MAFENLTYLTSFAGIFRLFTVILGFPSMVLVWVAYFSSSWTKAFPEIVAILIVEKTLPGEIFGSNAYESTDEDDQSTKTSTTFKSTESPSDEDSSSSSESDYDLISDKEEEYLDEILLQTLMYEKFFIGIVTVVFIISTSYLVLRVVSKHQLDSPYEIMFDFIYHVVSALGLLTGSALVLLSAAKIQSFIDQVSDDDLTPEIIANILQDKEKVQDKADKIAASVIGMINGIIYALCVATLRMTTPSKIGTKCCVRRDKKIRRTHLAWRQRPANQEFPRVSIVSLEGQTNDSAMYGFY